MNGRRIACAIMAAMLCLSLAGCAGSNKTPRIGVSLGVGMATRWESEKTYMEERAAELGVDIEVRLNRTDEPKTQLQDCIEMIDGGIDVLIYTPRDATKATDVLEYAASKKVPVISYARIVLWQKVDLFVGYDSNRIGQRMGQYLSETVFEGDYILLHGDENDNNATLLKNGAMRYIDPIRDSINIILDAPVPGWSPEEAERMVTEAIVANGNKVDAIFAPNDKLAGACVKALEKLNITTPVTITGMDAELEAAQRIAAGTQGSTVYMDLRTLAYTAVDEAVNLAKKDKVNVNAEFDNESGALIPSNLITGQLVTIDNLDKVLIDSGHFTREDVYGTP